MIRTSLVPGEYSVPQSLAALLVAGEGCQHRQLDRTSGSRPKLQEDDHAPRRTLGDLYTVQWTATDQPTRPCDSVVRRGACAGSPKCHRCANQSAKSHPPAYHLSAAT